MSDWLSMVGGPVSVIDGAVIIILSLLTVWRSRRLGRLFLLSSFVGLIALVAANVIQVYLRTSSLSIELHLMAVATLTLGRLILFCVLCAAAISIWRIIFNQIGRRRLFS